MSEGINVIWASDGSQSCYESVPLIRSLILPAAASIRVVTVGPQPIGGGTRLDPYLIQRWSGQQKEEALARALATARRSADLLGGESDVVRAESRFGHTVQELLRAADQHKADLIVIGAKGRSNLKMMLLGSVAHGVLDYSPRPVLMVRPGSPTVRTAIAGIDGSPEALNALRFLLRLALPDEAVIVLLRVVGMVSERPWAAPNGDFAEKARRINEDLRSRAEADLTAAHDVLAGTHRAALNEIQAGKPAEQILLAAADRDADLIVAGSRPPSRPKRFVIGSTAEHLAREALTSVLVVR